MDWTKFLVGYLFVIKILTSVRDAMDATPESDDNAFERAVTIISKTASYLTLGKRAK